MNNLLLIFIGAGTGGVLRYLISRTVYQFVKGDFPFGTLVVNVSGCFIMGLLFVVLFDRMVESASSLRALLLIGLLGGYTTFSSFSIETITLIENGEMTGGLVNIFLSVGMCLLATWFGVFLGRML